MNAAILLVTYNRIELLKKSISCILNQSEPFPHLVIVDNFSTDNTFEYLISFFNLSAVPSSFDATVCPSSIFEGFYKGIKVSIIKLSMNTGGSGGFYSGIKYILENLCVDWIWGMDDDAFCFPDALEKLKFAIVEKPDIQAFWSNCNADNNFHVNQKYKETDTWMFVGFLISKQLIQSVGLPVCDYFIYHDDSEYSERIIRNGYKIIKVKESMIEHGDLSQRQLWQRNILGRKIEFPAMPDWKLYYFIRNFLLKNRYSIKSFLLSFYNVLKILMKLMLVKPSKISIAGKAFFHGVLNKKGKLH